MSSPLPKELYEELGAMCRGEVYLRDEPGFEDYSTIFNGNVKSLSKAVAVPLDAQDVSKIILFCVKHSLSPSVKAGGYGTAGWAINGDIIIDLSKLAEVDIEPPHADGSFSSLKDVASANSKGKQALPSGSNSGKRRREDDAALRRYDQASRAVATFLCGSAGPAPPDEGPSPNVRRRIEVTSYSSNGSATPPSASSGSSSNVSNASTVATTPSPPRNGAGSHSPNGPPNRGADPFGYLDDKNHTPPAPPVGATQSVYAPSSMLRSWATNSGTLLGYQNLPPGQMALAEPIYPHAFVTFGAGMRQKEIDTYTARHKLEARYANGNIESIPYHVPFAAHPVGSSIMLLGGFGFLSRLHGMSIDNLVEVEMVLADGRIVIVNERDYPDLWWALRGAGSVLGVATRYKAKAFPVPVVFAGNLIYRFNAATTPSLIKHFRDCVKGAPRELYANVLLTAGPPGKDSLAVVQMCYIGSREKGQEFLAAISSWDGERCLLNEVDEKSFLHQQDSVAQVLRGKAGRQWFIRSALITSLPDDIINQTVLQFAGTPVGCTWLFELAGGAIADYEDTCVPKSQREAAFTIAALHQWEIDVHDDRCIASAEEWISRTLKPVHQGGPIPSFLGRHESPERTKASFGANWDRLCEIKKLYDPNNLFRNSFWPLNAEGETVEAYTHEPPTP
ncbi:putative oxygen-dependent FAD-linked oxidoreductase family protein [Lyophyllum shimeji]|uniref:Oxygen-dependent FAD-linked oxidoreductase family protein n=1 Tax=Lyophyllum shimeji TaxID=47721 RepID=A0A9P3PL43_LYOSH|nr:putative oxygen-dependent FAD-linked oxidoreductase family protein [Lyophyllum shimeji]